MAKVIKAAKAALPANSPLRASAPKPPASAVVLLSYISPETGEATPEVYVKAVKAMPRQVFLAAKDVKA